MNIKDALSLLGISSDSVANLQNYNEAWELIRTSYIDKVSTNHYINQPANSRHLSEKIKQWSQAYLDLSKRPQRGFIDELKQACGQQTTYNPANTLPKLVANKNTEQSLELDFAIKKTIEKYDPTWYEDKILKVTASAQAMKKPFIFAKKTESDFQVHETRMMLSKILGIKESDFQLTLTNSPLGLETFKISSTKKVYFELIQDFIIAMEKCKKSLVNNEEKIPSYENNKNIDIPTQRLPSLDVYAPSLIQEPTSPGKDEKALIQELASLGANNQSLFKEVASFEEQRKAPLEKISLSLKQNKLKTIFQPIHQKAIFTSNPENKNGSLITNIQNSQQSVEFNDNKEFLMQVQGLQLKHKIKEPIEQNSENSEEKTDHEANLHVSTENEAPKQNLVETSSEIEKNSEVNQKNEEIEGLAENINLEQEIKTTEEVAQKKVVSETSDPKAQIRPSLENQLDALNAIKVKKLLELLDCYSKHIEQKIAGNKGKIYSATPVQEKRNTLMELIKILKDSQQPNKEKLQAFKLKFNNGANFITKDNPTVFFLKFVLTILSLGIACCFGLWKNEERDLVKKFREVLKEENNVTESVNNASSPKA